MRVSPNGGTPERLLGVKDGERVTAPQMLPGGQAVLFTIAPGDAVSAQWDKAQVVVQTLKPGPRKTLIEVGSDGRYLPTGHLVYAVGGVLYAVPFDLGTPGGNRRTGSDRGRRQCGRIPSRSSASPAPDR